MRNFRLIIVLCAVVIAAGNLSAAAPPENMGRGLRELFGEYTARRTGGQSERQSFRASVANSAHAQADGNSRVLVDVMLNGTAPVPSITKQAGVLGGTVTATIPWYRHGLVTVWVPLRVADRLARTPGVAAVHLVPRRGVRVGEATSQGAVVHHTDLVNGSGYLGAGVTVGVLSDSYNDDAFDASDPGWTTASQDVATGDLPGANSPNGYTTPVLVLQDGTSPQEDTDEGRAMLQIVHDVAPAAKLAFCTAGNSDAEMAANILRLQSQGGCQVICDDTYFFDEPMFSDGVIAQAINQVAAGGVTYFSAIGNDGNSGYQATFNPVSNTIGRAHAATGGVTVSSIPAAESNVISEWHAFATSGTNPIVVQNITTGSGATTIIFQWDDPFDVITSGTKGITSDYDILVFNSAGTYQAKLSGTANNITANEPIELPSKDLTANTAYKICIVLTTRLNGSVARQATHLRYLATDDTDVVTGDYINLNNVTAQGHPYAAGSIGVGAYNYDVAPDPGNANHAYKPIVDGYSSNGPVDIYFDSAGNRLATPLVRKQPAIACTDNVDTTFFPPSSSSPNPNDYDDDGYPNFAGTSAATPHAAGIAALLINAAAVNNLGTLSPQEIEALMIATTLGSMDEDPLFCSGTAGPVTATNSGDGVILPNIFEISLSSTATGLKITNVTITLNAVSMHFDSSNTDENGEQWALISTTGSPAPTAGTPTFSGSPSDSTLNMTFTNFGPGDTLSFAVGFDDNDTDEYGYDSDELGGATFTATVSGTTYSGTLENNLGRTYNFKAGFGLLDAQAALNLLLGQ